MAKLEELRKALIFYLLDVGADREYIIPILILLKNDYQATLDILRWIHERHPTKTQVLKAAQSITDLIPDPPKP